MAVRKRAKAKRSYTQTTLKLLFALSRNECAHPDCENPIVERATPQDDPAVVGQICHIYAIKNKGPRGKPNLTEEKRNSPSNLILLCGHHHPIVDKQYKSYPAKTLQLWKKVHETKTSLPYGINKPSNASFAYSQDVIDREIEKDLARLRQARFINGFSIKDETIRLARKIDIGEFSSGSNIIRSKALAWCARFLSKDDITLSRELIDKSKVLGSCSEAEIAAAFVLANTDISKALQKLALISSPLARSAALIIKGNKASPKEALKWIEETGLTLDSFDSDGKLLIVMYSLATDLWDNAINFIPQLSEEDFRSTPAIANAAAMAYLMQAVPEDLRQLVLRQIPFEASQFPLSADDKSMEARRKASELFIKSSRMVKELGCDEAANVAADYSLWLNLRDPRDTANARQDLLSSMRNPEQSLRHVPFALQFGVQLDLPSVEREMDRKIALSGKGNADEAVARFALAFTQKSPKAVAEYIAQHRSQLYEHLDKTSIQLVEIEMLARAGLNDEAQIKLTLAIEEGLGEREKQRLLSLLSKPVGTSPVSERKALYLKTGELRDLINLVSLLESDNSWLELCEFGPLLYEKTHALEDGIRVAKALHKSGKHKALFDFLNANLNLISLSEDLKMLWAWALYREGKFDDSSLVLKELRLVRDHVNDRALAINLAVSSGGWESLAEITAREWENRDSRTAQELLTAAQLAQATNSHHAKELVIAAATKGKEDAGILASAYFHATRAGWEQMPEVSQWLERAAYLSGENGPIQKISMKDIFDRKPAWDRQEENIWRQLNSSALPMFAAARLLHRSLIDFILLPSLANVAEQDVRRRSVVYAYSGFQHQPIASANKVALDVSALLTFTRIGLLETVIQHYDEIIISHSTLGWLFREKQEAAFHQPSRIKEAMEISQLTATGSLKIVQFTGPRNNVLVKEVGEHLAMLLSTVRTKAQANDGIARFVIRSSPVHLVGSLMAEEADLASYYDCLCSCQAVVTKLKEKCLLTVNEERHARSYLTLQERRWPSEPTIPDNAELYLDNLSVKYLQTIGVLDKLKAIGLETFILEEDVNDANLLISFGALSKRQLNDIEVLRRTLQEGLHTGRVRAARTMQVEEADILQQHPTVNILGLDEPVDAIVVDDRFLNKHPKIETNGRNLSILSSLNIINDLFEKGKISQEDYFAHRIMLRRAGYQFIPLTLEEISYHLSAASISNGGVIETAELKAIRESFLQARIKKILQIPGEIPWLHQSMNAITMCIKEFWIKYDAATASAYSEWLLPLLDMRPWAGSALPGNERAFAICAYGARILGLTSASSSANREQQKQYLEWVDKRLIEDIKKTEPEIFEWLIEQCQILITETVKMNSSEVEGDISIDDLQDALVVASVKHFSKLIRNALISKTEFRSQYNLSVQATLTIGEAGEFQQSQLLDSARKITTISQSTDLTDVADNRWKIQHIKDTANIPIIALMRDKKRIFFSLLALVSEDKEMRLAVFEHEANRLNLSSRIYWLTILKARPLNNDEWAEILEDIKNTPIHFRDVLVAELSSGRATLDDLVPQPSIYYERLIGELDSSVTSLSQYVEAKLAPHLSTLIEWEHFAGFQFALLLSSNSQITVKIATLDIDTPQLLKVYEWLIKKGNILSIIGGIEVGLSLLDKRPEILPALQTLIEIAVTSENRPEGNRLKLFSMLTILIYGELAEKRVLASYPVFYRRLAAISQAAFVEQALLDSGANLEDFIKWMATVGAHSFMLQTLVDLRTEPRWLPDFGLPQQMKQELNGRIYIAANANEASVVKAGLKRYLLEEDGNLRKDLKIAQIFLPGPLEGNNEPVIELLGENLEAVKADLLAEKVTSSSFVSIVNVAFLFKLPAELGDMAAEALIRGEHALDTGEDKQLLFGILHGLASIAAITRNKKLADELVIALRKYRQFHPEILSISDINRIAITACASRANLDVNLST